MRAPFRNTLLGASAVAAMAVAIGGALLLHDPATSEAAEARPSTAAQVAPNPTLPAPQPSDALPTPPEPPRLAEGPEYDQCLALLRTDPEEAMARAAGWEERGGGDGARHCLALGLLAVGETERAAERLERLAANSPASPAVRAAIYAQAVQAWMLGGGLNRAYGAATLALSLTPRDTALLVDRAVAAGGLGRYAEALLDLDQAIGQEGSRADAWVFRAAALRHLDRQEEAMGAVQHALSLDARNAEALLERGILRQLKGDTRGARQDWQQVVKLAPDSAAADLAAQNLALNEAGPKRR